MLPSNLSVFFCIHRRFDNDGLGRVTSRSRELFCPTQQAQLRQIGCHERLDCRPDIDSRRQSQGHPIDASEFPLQKQRVDRGTR